MNKIDEFGNTFDDSEFLKEAKGYLDAFCGALDEMVYCCDLSTDVCYNFCLSSKELAAERVERRRRFKPPKRSRINYKKERINRGQDRWKNS